MAYVNFDSLNNAKNSNATTKEFNNSVGFFSLKNDKDEAIVRFMHDDTSSFEILETHAIQLNGKFRRLNCIRTPMQPIDACPMCAKGEKVDYRFFIHLLQYTKNPDGSVSVEPKVWERSLSYANKLSEYINNYGPLSDIICKVVRHGVAGDMKTEYEIIPNLNKQIYRDDIFVKKLGCFDNYKALGTTVLDKTADEINEYLQTGNFPMKKQENKTPEGFTQAVSANTTNWNDTTPNWGTTTSTDDLPKWSVEQTATAQPSRNFNWTSSDSQQVNRPTRF